MVLFYLVFGTDIDEYSGCYPFSGFAAISNIEIKLVALTVFPFLDIHIPAFCKVKNIITSNMPIIAVEYGLVNRLGTPACPVCKRDERWGESASGDWDTFSDGVRVTYDPDSWSPVEAVSCRSGWRRYEIRMDLACDKQVIFDLVLEGAFAEKRMSLRRCMRVRIAVFSCVIS